MAWGALLVLVVTALVIRFRFEQTWSEALIGSMFIGGPIYALALIVASLG